MKDVPLQDLIRVDKATGMKALPHWLAQPYFRPLSPGERGKGMGVP